LAQPVNLLSFLLAQPFEVQDSLITCNGQIRAIQRRYGQAGPEDAYLQANISEVLPSHILRVEVFEEPSAYSDEAPRSRRDQHAPMRERKHASLHGHGLEVLAINQKRLELMDGVCQPRLFVIGRKQRSPPRHSFVRPEFHAESRASSMSG